MIRFDRSVCGDVIAASSREWLETNGIGGFASSTILGLNTRRYHGLLVAALGSPSRRFVLLSKLEESLLIGQQAVELGANQYPGVIHPHGYRYLVGFRLDPFPIFTYNVEGIEIEKSVFMLEGDNSVVVQYELTKNNHPESPRELHLEVRPLLAFRDYHCTTHENPALDRDFDVQPGTVSMRPYSGLPVLHLAHDASGVTKTGYWYRNLEYEQERQRGLEYAEDLFNPLQLCFELRSQRRVSILTSTAKHSIALVEAFREDEIHRRSHVVAEVSGDCFARALTRAGHQFLVRGTGQRTVIAGYPWFGEWGRDTMIALPGLMLATGRLDLARQVLGTWAKRVDQGMLPNQAPLDHETPAYNTVDATLWFLEAGRSYLERSDDQDFVRRSLYPRFVEIISWHLQGTRHGIRVDSGGLLNCGEQGTQLTWMDAKVGDWVVTPRLGKPVEIQALWYNALCAMAELAHRFGDGVARKRYQNMAAIARWTFNRLFWNERESCLYDVVEGDRPDPSIRPNQIFAVSLRHSMLGKNRTQCVVDKVRQHLLTPYGLRSLSPSDPHYRGRYEGGPAERDAAYHQGTVWPWLLGPFITAYMKVHGCSESARVEAERWLLPLRDYVLDRGVGQIPEIFEGDSPHRAVGCIAQAWSVSEILRVYREVVMNSAAKTRMKDARAKSRSQAAS